MGYNARADAVEQTLRALESVLSQQKHKVPRGAAVDAALSVYR
jgi:aspartate aminotransferase-like enzyme